ncbi:aromatic acid/H+ symport family MFS transporter [Paraburkholderia sp. C35]|uniref:MFS transporter n=1 Tax=Paraburkholderia sp. C35 TaxID=2126993 RepID=UPI000D6888BC|nr:aromatic acid/H+ symport family MFS transporter [Paraburkholderia sp. C35]
MWDVTCDALEDARINRYHLLVFVCCSMLMTFDGYDLVIYGSVLQHIVKEWSLSSVYAGFMGSSALFGMMVGAILLGSSSDRFGRKTIIQVSLVVFSVAVVGSALSQNPVSFIVWRFLTGFGIGGLSPNIVAMTSEMSPKKHRNLMVTAMLSCFSIGGIIAAAVGMTITPVYGWRGDFLLGGLSLLLVPFIHIFLPESASFLLTQGRFDDASRVLLKVAPGFRGDVTSLVKARSGGQREAALSKVARLFAEGRIVSTPLLWLSFGMCMFMVYGLSTWIPTLMVKHGYTANSSLTFFLMLNAGAFVGASVSGVLADKISGRTALVLFFVLSFVSIGLLGYPQPAWFQTALLMLGGASTIGTLCILHSFAAQYYPASIRSTAVSWAGSCGRFGAVAGPAVGGYLVGLQLPTSSTFMAFAIPGIVAAFAIALVRGTGGRAQHRPSPSPSKG